MFPSFRLIRFNWSSFNLSDVERGSAKKVTPGDVRSTWTETDSLGSRTSVHCARVRVFSGRSSTFYANVTVNAIPTFGSRQCREQRKTDRDDASRGWRLYVSLVFGSPLSMLFASARWISIARGCVYFENDVRRQLGVARPKGWK